MKFSDEAVSGTTVTIVQVRDGAMVAALSDFLGPQVLIAIGLMVVGSLLMYLAWPIQKRISRYHQRIRDAEFASPRAIRISGWRYDTTLILFGALLLILGVLMFLITFPWGDL
ncbi:MAG: hypothetical protein IPM17_18530 [Verrucomicrobia bacterium]|jgi:hypothetical protein|nr:hypothetical protein [Verrucomicrobiota bacterium]